MDAQQKNEWLTAANLAEMLHMSRRTIWRMAATGQLPAPARLSARSTRWSRAAVEARLAELASKN